MIMIWPDFIHQKVQIQVILKIMQFVINKKKKKSLKKKFMQNIDFEVGIIFSSAKQLKAAIINYRYVVAKQRKIRLTKNDKFRILAKC